MVGMREAASVGGEFPAVIGAADAAVLVAAKEQVGAAVRAARRDETDRAVGGAERTQVLAEDGDADRRAVGFRQFGAEQHGMPEAAEQVAHRRLRAGAGEQDVIGFGKHGVVPRFALPSCLVRNRLGSIAATAGAASTGIAAEDQIGGETAGGGRGLDAITALPHAPEKPFPSAIPAEGQAAVRGEGAQPGPGMFDAANLDVERLLHAVDAGRDIDFLGLDVVRVGRAFRRRATPSGGCAPRDGRTSSRRHPAPSASVRRPRATGSTIAAVRRFGSSPIGATPAIAATSSPQAPAALTTTPAWNTAPEEVSTCQAPDARVMRPARLRNASTPFRVRSCRRNP